MLQTKYIQEMKSHKLATSALILTALLWSSTPLVVKIVDLHPLAIAGGRSLIAFMFMLCLVKHFGFNLSPPFIVAGIFLALTNLSFISAIRYTTAANAVLLQFAAPVYVALFGRYFLKERTGKLGWLIVTAIFGGVLLLFFDNLSSGSFWGNILGFLSGISYAWYLLILRKYAREQPLSALLIGHALIAFVGLFFLSVEDFSTFNIYGLIYLGLFPAGIGFLLQALATSRVSALEAALIPCLDPVLAPIWVLLVIGEAPGILGILGGLIVLIALSSFVWIQNKRGISIIVKDF